MSFFGRNIKKIRTAKNISQTVFADLFKLTRASIGAYEEGRAEAKIDTVIEIADYFQLSLDQLLKKELTFNDIYRIGEISRKLDLLKIEEQQDIEAPIVSSIDYTDFIKKFNNYTYIQGLQKLKFPGIKRESIAFEFSNALKTNLNSAFKEGDLLIGQRILKENFYQLIKNQQHTNISIDDLIVCITKINKQSKLYLTDIQNLNTLSENNEIEEVWHIYLLLGLIDFHKNNIDNRLQNLENLLAELLKKESKNN